MWKDSNITDSSTTEAACLEAELVDAGRFNGQCSSRYSNVFHGFAAEVRVLLCSRIAKGKAPPALRKL